MSDLRQCVLVVDDEFMIAELWTIHVENMGIEVCGVAATADEAVALALRHRPHVILMDVRLKGDKDGVDAAIEIHKSVGSRIIFVTGSTEPSTRDRIALDHPVATLFKPVSDRELQNAVQAAFLL